MRKWAFCSPGAGVDGRRRRSVLAGLLACVGVIGGVPRWAMTGDARAWLTGASSGARAFADPEAMRMVGALYLAAHPGESDPRGLFDALAGDRAAPFDEAIVERIARDWRAQEIVVLSGWVFARSEARLCALMHLDRAAR